MTRIAQRGLAALGRNQRMSSHQGTKITKSAAERVSHLGGFVAPCENQMFVFQGLAFPPIWNLRKDDIKPGSTNDYVSRKDAEIARS